MRGRRENSRRCDSGSRSRQQCTTPPIGHPRSSGTSGNALTCSIGRTAGGLERARADLSFHEAFVEAAGNRILLRTWRSLVGSITVMVLSVGEAEMTELQDPGDHKALLEAVASRDADEIRRTFTSHFEHGQRVVEVAMSRASTGKADERSQ
jgi:DNA-binding FadR family transcriptional regulator